MSCHMIFANYNPQNCIKMCRSLFVKPGTFCLQKFEKCRNVNFVQMYCWNSLASRLLGPLLLKSGRVWGWFVPKTFQGIHFLFSGPLKWSIDIGAMCLWNKFDEKAQCELGHYGHNCKILIKKLKASFCFWTDTSINMELRILFFANNNFMQNSLNTKRLQSFWIIFFW